MSDRTVEKFVVGEGAHPEYMGLRPQPGDQLEVVEDLKKNRAVVDYNGLLYEVPLSILDGWKYRGDIVEPAATST